MKGTVATTRATGQSDKATAFSRSSRCDLVAESGQTWREELSERGWNRQEGKGRYKGESILSPYQAFFLGGYLLVGFLVSKVVRMPTHMFNCDQDIALSKPVDVVHHFADELPVGWGASLRVEVPIVAPVVVPLVDDFNAQLRVGTNDDSVRAAGCSAQGLENCLPAVGRGLGR